MAEVLSTKQELQLSSLDASQKLADDLRTTLGSLATSASTLQNSVFQKLDLTRWMPLLLAPAAALTLGSYGLPPSMFRNLLLLVIG